jgi:hypothetical protein
MIPSSSISATLPSADLELVVPAVRPAPTSDAAALAFVVQDVVALRFEPRANVVGVVGARKRPWSGTAALLDTGDLAVIGSRLDSTRGGFP